MVHIWHHRLGSCPDNGSITPIHLTIALSQSPWSCTHGVRLSPRHSDADRAARPSDTVRLGGRTSGRASTVHRLCSCATRRPHRVPPPHPAGSGTLDTRAWANGNTHSTIFLTSDGLSGPSFRWTQTEGQAADWLQRHGPRATRVVSADVGAVAAERGVVGGLVVGDATVPRDMGPGVPGARTSVAHLHAKQRSFVVRHEIDTLLHAVVPSKGSSIPIDGPIVFVLPATHVPDPLVAVAHPCTHTL